MVEDDSKRSRDAEALPFLSEPELVAKLVKDKELQTANNNAAIRVCVAKRFTNCVALLVRNPRVDVMAGDAVKDLILQYRKTARTSLYGIETEELPKIRETLLLLLSSPKFRLGALDPVTQNSLNDLVLQLMDDGDEQLALAFISIGAYVPATVLISKASRLGYSVKFAKELEKHQGLSLDSLTITKSLLVWLLQDVDVFMKAVAQSHAPSDRDLALVQALALEVGDAEQDALLAWMEQPKEEERMNQRLAEYERKRMEEFEGKDYDDLYS